MTNREVVNQLKQLGHKVKFYVRKDGSIRITQIDEEKFSSHLSKGNLTGRQILEKESSWYDPGEELRQEAIRKQRLAAQKSRASGKTLRSQSKQFQEEFKRLQNRIRQTNKKLIAQGKRPLSVPSWLKTREASEKAGISTEQQLNRAKDYFIPLTGNVAPRVMVQALINQCLLYEKGHPEIIPVRKFLEDNINHIDIYSLNVAHNWVYGIASNVKQSMNNEELIKLLKETLH